MFTYLHRISKVWLQIGHKRGTVCRCHQVCHDIPALKPKDAQPRLHMNQISAVFFPPQTSSPPTVQALTAGNMSLVAQSIAWTLGLLLKFTSSLNIFHFVLPKSESAVLCWQCASHLGYLEKSCFTQRVLERFFRRQWAASGTVYVLFWECT